MQRKTASNLFKFAMKIISWFLTYLTFIGFKKSILRRAKTSSKHLFDSSLKPFPKGKADKETKKVRSYQTPQPTGYFYSVPSLGIDNYTNILKSCVCYPELQTVQRWCWKYILTNAIDPSLALVNSLFKYWVLPSLFFSSLQDKNISSQGIKDEYSMRVYLYDYSLDFDWSPGIMLALQRYVYPAYVVTSSWHTIQDIRVLRAKRTNHDTVSNS